LVLLDAIGPAQLRFAFGDMATLLEITQRLTEFDASDAIYAAEPWQPSSVAVVLNEPRDGSLPAEAHRLSCRLLLDIAVGRAVMIGFRAWLKREPSLEERCLELIRFATKTPNHCTRRRDDHEIPCWTPAARRE
jgi:hypothetical protein